MIRTIGVNNKIVNITENMYNKTKWFEVAVGFRQGCLLSTTLFKLFLDFTMKEVKCLQE